MISSLPLIRLNFRPRKALAAVQACLHWAHRDGRGSVDLHTILKTCYFADKVHLNEHWRPILGCTYRAMTYGPVPLEVYQMLNGEMYWLAELGRDDYPWRRVGYHIEPTTDAEPDLAALSRSEVAALEVSFGRARAMTFDERTAESHDLAWERARLGTMCYADMVDEDNPDRDDILDELYEDGHRWLA